MSELKCHPWEGFLPQRTIIMARRARSYPASSPENAPQAESETENQTPTPEVTFPTSSALQQNPALQKIDTLERVAADLEGCVRCKLCQRRKTIVVGEGNPQAELVFVGEGPGEQEDLQGRPFVGKAGQLLDKMIQAIGLERDQVYIANVVKCRPPGNRNPEPDEIEACSSFLYRQLQIIQPKVVVALGKFAAQTLLQTEERISTLRGRFHSYRGAKLMPTFHPSYLLRNPASKKEAWEDLQLVARELKLQLPKRK
jgi:DNA polymerase